ncbi:MAG: hypothetical protein OXJ90_18730 [Spirochaetaceae bacterium]|nr:hypothetical protein [Spirochaetaceae bacterium]
MDTDTQRMTKKSTILFPPILYQELQAAARQQGRSVGDLVREAVEIQYGSGGVAARLRAVEALAQLDDDVPDDPRQLESEIVRGATER